MKATFEIQNWLSENREVVITKYNQMTKEEFFNGISLKNFMVQVLDSMVRNNIKSEKRAASMLPFLMGDVYFQNSKIDPAKRDYLAAKYEGTAYMALV